jgi:nitroreductase
MEIFEALRRRRMTRSFQPEPPSEEELAQLVWAAGRSPQAGNMPVRRLVVVTDPRTVRAVRQVSPSFIADAPAFILVCTDTAVAGELMGPLGRDVVSLMDAGATAQSIALAATAIGLGVCFSRSTTDSALRAILDLPEEIRPDLVVAVGRPADGPKGKAGVRLAPAPVYRERWGQAWEEPA